MCTINYRALPSLNSLNPLPSFIADNAIFETIERHCVNFHTTSIFYHVKYEERRLNSSLYTKHKMYNIISVFDARAFRWKLDLSGGLCESGRPKTMWKKK